MRRTVITHVLNEAELLAHWLPHHARMFQHGVVIDCGSTDGSVDLVRSLCPTWDVLIARDPWNPDAIDDQVMDVESRTEGWKIALTAGEFLLPVDFDATIAALESEGRSEARTTGYLVVEAPWERLTPLEGQSIIWTRQHGHKETEASYLTEAGHPVQGHGPIGRCRLLHRNRRGKYKAGRHKTDYDPIAEIREDLPLAWFGLGLPALKCRRNRQLAAAIKRKHHWCGHHLFTDQQIERSWAADWVLSYHLPSRHPHYARGLAAALRASATSARAETECSLPASLGGPRSANALL